MAISQAAIDAAKKIRDQQRLDTRPNDPTFDTGTGIPVNQTGLPDVPQDINLQPGDIQPQPDEFPYHIPPSPAPPIWRDGPPQDAPPVADPEPPTGGSGSGGNGSNLPPLQQPAPAGDTPYYAPPGGGSATAPPAGATGVPNELEAAYRAAILKLLQTPQEVDPTSLAGSSENRAYRLAAQRAQERNMAQLAETAAAEGWSSSGGFEGAQQGLRQARGEGEAGFLGQLAVTKMQQNREALVQGIQFAMSQDQFEDAQVLQRELANLDAAIRREIANGQLGFNYAQLNENSRQFGLSLGFDYSQLQAMMNQAATEAALGGY